ncbi:hypothetical protein ACFTAO_41580 [Paenibacillus rhizoplanae]
MKEWQKQSPYLIQQNKNEISEAAKKAGLDKVYIPTVGLGSDDYMDRVEVKDNQVRIVFIRGAITQSTEELKPTNEIVSTKKLSFLKMYLGSGLLKRIKYRIYTLRKTNCISV